MQGGLKKRWTLKAFANNAGAVRNTHVIRLMCVLVGNYGWGETGKPSWNSQDESTTTNTKAAFGDLLLHG